MHPSPEPATVPAPPAPPRLEQLTPGTTLRGLLPHATVTVAATQWHGADALTLTYRTVDGTVAQTLLFRDDEPRLAIAHEGRPWSFDGDGALFRLAAEAHRIRLAYLFDPLLAVHTSLVDPLPHQITAVYEEMLPRQPLRFLLADDPGAGKTIMAGLLIKELIARADLRRCLIVCPGSLVEQWQDELARRFHLPFDILTTDQVEAARSGNWFAEQDLAIARLDKLARNDALQEQLLAPEAHWDLVVFDEAHKLSASFFGGEVKYTRRYKLAQLLSARTRHLLLMTATPHNGKEEDFQLFLALLDGDRFEGRFRDGVHQVEVRDLMRRMVKEKLLTFEGRPLFPERIASTVRYRLSDGEAALYRAVTEYVREEFNRADALENERRAGTVGFALTVLQRRLASSPEAILQSLRRRRERLERQRRETELLNRAADLSLPLLFSPSATLLDADAIDDLEEAPGDEVERAEQEVLDQATAARTIAELRTEIERLQHLESLARGVALSGEDTKWRELSRLLQELVGSERRNKLVVFTEHRDTLAYLQRRIASLLGRDTALASIHGAMGREERRKAQERFLHDPEVLVLLATDAAGEGINLQRAHLMVNYDLPWNPNRLEQRFGRIHRIGQVEVCHLWNLVADETREGDVYATLLAKLEESRRALGGEVFDVLGKLQFEGRPLRDLLVEAIRYGDRPDVRERLTQVVANGVDREQLRRLIDDHSLVPDAMDASRVAAIRDEMQRAEARRLQPHFVATFFAAAFAWLGGRAYQREPRRWEVTHVPAAVRERDRRIGRGEPVLPRYERITFEKERIAPPGEPLAAFVAPGHPLLDAVIDLTLERCADLLRQGTVLVDERDASRTPRVLFLVEHAVHDATVTPSGERRAVSRRMLYVEIDAAGGARHLHYAPYLDYRPLAESEPPPRDLFARPELAWISRAQEEVALQHAVTHLAPAHVAEVRERRAALVDRTRAAVQERLTKEIAWWDHRAADLQLSEQAGKPNARQNSAEARRRADELQGRLQRRLEALEEERHVSSAPPVVRGGLLVIPAGLLGAAAPLADADTARTPDTLAAAARARAAVMAVERTLGFQPVDREFERLGYDIESRDPRTGTLRFLEVKGRQADGDTITVTRNEILYSLNQPETFILALVEFLDGERHRVSYLRRPFAREPDFGVTSVNYAFADLLARATTPA